MKNWWYYHKWYVILGAVIIAGIANIACNALGLFKKVPDYCIAYVGKTALPKDAVSMLEERFAEISSDFNGDGEVIVQLRQYVDNSQVPGAEADASYYELSSEITLIGDITDCDSYFFIMDDPGLFQKEFHILALPDGSCPDDTDYSTEDKAFLGTDIPALANMELLSQLYIGRRCFYTENKVKNVDKCDELWDSLFQ